MNFRRLKQLNVRNKRVLVRTDFNVPLDKKGRVADDLRIMSVLPTIRYLLAKKAKIILISHLGRPKGRQKKFSLAPAAKRLQKILNRKVVLAKAVTGRKVLEQAEKMRPGSILVLENLRFDSGEEKNSSAFAKELAGLADFYVNDAFAVSHRSHSSVDAITKYLPSAAGFLLEREVSTMEMALNRPKRPFIAVIGGAKVGDKIEVINALLKKVDAVLIGGAMMFTFLKASGERIGTSLVENGKLKVARALLKKGHTRIIMPTDCIVAKRPEKKAKKQVVDVRNIPKGMMGLDIGPETIAVYCAIISSAKTIIWNGPLGLFEISSFAEGTRKIANAMADSGALTVVGGGDSAEAVRKFELDKKFTHVSTGGGASLDFFAGKKLPGIAALERNYKKFK